uniref:Anaphase-promoting complex subunit 4 WD40 domain-containing protein n=1 Tax=viral metagenome TaxID=1070528 RepID=A0A6C0HS42_9ZZZZ
MTQNKPDTITLEYAKEPIIAAAYSYHPAYQTAGYNEFYEASKILTFSQGTHFSKLKLYGKSTCIKTENEFTELSAQKCMLNKGKILSVAPSPVNNKLTYVSIPAANGKPCEGVFPYANRGLTFNSSNVGGHLNKIALGTDSNSIVIVCNEFCYAKVKAGNDKLYEICQPKVLGEPTMRGGSRSDSDDSDNSDDNDSSDEDEMSAEEEKKKEQEETEKLNAEEAWDAEEEKFKPPITVKPVNLEKQIKIDAHTGPVNALAWNSTGTRLVSGSSDTTLRMWSYVETNNVQLPEFEEFAKTDAAREWAKIKIENYRPKDYERGIIGRNWNEINEQNIKFHLLNNGHESLVRIVKNGVDSYSPQEDMVAKKAYDIWKAPLLKKYNDELKTAWELEEWKCDWISKEEKFDNKYPRYHAGPILSLAWSPDDKIIASGSQDNLIILWNPDDGKFKQKLEGHTGPVRCLVWSYDSTILYSCSDDGSVKMWKKTGEKYFLAQTLDSQTTGLTQVNVNEKYIVAGSTDGKIYVWDSTSYEFLIELKKHDGAITGLFWKDPRDPTQIVNPPPSTKDIKYDKPIAQLIKNPEEFISTSLDKKIKITTLSTLVAEEKKRIQEEERIIRDGRPSQGTDYGGPDYQEALSQLEKDQIEDPNNRMLKLKQEGGKRNGGKRNGGKRNGGKRNGGKTGKQRKIRKKTRKIGRTKLRKTTKKAAPRKKTRRTKK